MQDLLARMTLEEKFWQLYMLPENPDTGLTRYRHGVFGFQIRNDRRVAAGTTRASEADPASAARAMAERINTTQRYFVTETRLGIPIIPFEEALHGLVQDGATSYPQAIALSATWDTALVGRVADAIADETRTRGVRQVLSPVLNIASDVRWGRVEETYGEDPWLASRMGVAYVGAFERAGVVTTPKHFVANVGAGGRDSYPIDVDQRTLDEIYFPPFEAAIRRTAGGGGARSIMAAYNSVGGSPSTANAWLLTKTLRNDWGFRGFVIADAGAIGGANVLHFTSADYATSTARAITAGLDVIFQTSYEQYPLFWEAFRKGMIPGAAIDRAVHRVLRVKFELGLFENPYVDAAAAARSSATPSHRALALEAARAAMTLLRNDGGLLPLRASHGSIAVIGSDAIEARLGGYSGTGNSPVSILDGIRHHVGDPGRVRYAPGPGRSGRDHFPIPAQYLRPPAATDAGAGLRAEYFDNIRLEGTPRVVRRDDRVDFAWTLFAPDSSLAPDWYSVRWSGRLVAPASGVFRIGVEGTDGYRLFLGDSLLIDNWRKQSYRATLRAVRLERAREYPVRLEYFESTGNAHVSLVWSRPGAPDRVRAIADAAQLASRSDVAVVVVGLEEGEFRDRASLQLPGDQEGLIHAVASTGTPVIVVLVGGSAITMRSWIDRVGAVLDAWYPGEVGGEAVADALFGVASPAGRLPITFPLAEGQLPLTYNHKPTGRGDDYLDLTGRPLFPFGFGLSYTTFEYTALAIDPPSIAGDGSAQIRCRVRNSGSREGDEVVQLYVRDELASVVRPVMQLAGFRRVHLAPTAEEVVSFRLSREQLGMLNGALRRIVEPGTFRILVGASSADIRLRGTLSVK